MLSNEGKRATAQFFGAEAGLMSVN
jgi:hypothetical protein